MLLKCNLLRLSVVLCSSLVSPSMVSVKYVQYSDTASIAGYIQGIPLPVSGTLECANLCTRRTGCHVYGYRAGTPGAGNTSCCLVEKSSTQNSFTPVADYVYRKMSGIELVTYRICGVGLEEMKEAAPPPGWNVVCFMKKTATNINDPCYQLLENLETKTRTYADEGTLRQFGGNYACETFQTLNEVMPTTLCKTGTAQDITIASRCSTCEVLAVCLQFP